MILGAAAVAGTPAQAAVCWSEDSYQAAQMRDFDTMLMVATLRCRIREIDFSADYNRFVQHKRSILAGANTTLRKQFAMSVGNGHALGAYDDFMTKIANSYGGGAEGKTCNDFAQMASRASAMPASRGAIVALAREAGVKPPIPGRRCDVTVAMKAEK